MGSAGRLQGVLASRPSMEANGWCVRPLAAVDAHAQSCCRLFCRWACVWRRRIRAPVPATTAAGAG